MLSTTGSESRKALTTERRLLSGMVILIFCALATCPRPSFAETTVTDDRGARITLEAPAGRIISLAPSMTELLFSIGAGERIVGVMAHSNYPPEASDIPVVGQHNGLDMERIVSLRPDLVIAWQSGNPGGALRRLESMGIPVYVAEPESLEDIAHQLDSLAALTGLEEQGERVATDFREHLASLERQYTDAEPVRVFYQVWNSPLITAGGGELIDDIIDLCGGDNVFGDLPVGPKVGVEAVLQRQPDIIVGSGVDGERPSWLDEWQRWPQLPAIQKDHVYHIEPDIIQRHSLRALQGAERLCALIDRTRTTRAQPP
ncbi:MAG: cobalamin-binding protein [Pseudomonadota bacterium]